MDCCTCHCRLQTMTPTKGLPYPTGLGANKTPDKLVSPGWSIVVVLSLTPPSLHSTSHHPTAPHLTTPSLHPTSHRPTALHLTTPSLHYTLYHHPHTPLHSLQEERIGMAANEVRSLLRILDNQTYACRSVEALQKLRRTLTEMCSDFSNSLYNTPSLANYGRKRSASTKDTPTLKKTA